MRPFEVYGAVVCALGTIVIALPAVAQEAAIRGSQQKSTRVVRTDTRPVIDGRMDEAAWQSAEVIDDFHELQPTEYDEPSERTVIRILYDENALYIAARMYDREPDRITARVLRQGEDLFGDDYIAVEIDPFYDRRSGYRFITNPNGIRQEGIFQNISDMQWEWEGIWYAAASIDDEGWVAEIEIPYKSISFDPAGDTWGLNFRRSIGRRDERIAWVSRNRQTNPGTSGIAVGFEGLEQGVGLDVIPSVTVIDRKSFGSGTAGPSTSSTDLDPSLNVFYKLTPSLTSALTINTDFSATEIDDRQVNLTRFDLFFPEKRDFFLQDADIFEFGQLDENGRPFFSRSIGLSPSGAPVDLEVGGKVTGRVGRFNIGALAVRQDEFGGVAADNAVVARVSANILRESTVGLIATEGDPGANESNSVQGIDFRYRNTRLPGGRILQSSIWAQRSNTEGITEDDGAWGIGIGAPNETGLRGGITLNHFEANFNPGLGFVNNSDVERLTFGSQYTWRPEEGFLRSILTGFNVERTDFISREGLQTRERNLRIAEIESRQGDEVEVRYVWRDEMLIEPFEIHENVVIPPGTYAFQDFNFELRTADNRKFWGTWEHQIGPFFNGDRVQTELGISWRPSGRFFGTISYITNDIHMPEGDFITRLAQYRAEIVFSPKLSWVTLVQYDNVTEVAGLNSRVVWIPEPGREAFLVVNHNVQDLDGDNRFNSLSSDASIKFNYTFRF